MKKEKVKSKVSKIKNIIQTTWAKCPCSADCKVQFRIHYTK